MLGGDTGRLTYASRCAAIVALNTVFLGGCGAALTAVQLAEADRQANAYVYQGKSYETRAQAEAAYQKRIADLLKQVEALPDPVAGHARIVVPNKDALLHRQAQRIGRAEVNDYRATTGSEHIRMHATAIARRNLFSRHEIVETSTPDHLSPSADAALVYFYVSPGGEWASWYYVSNTTPRTPLRPEEAPGTARWLGAFLTNLEDVARKDNAR